MMNPSFKKKVNKGLLVFGRVLILLFFLIVVVAPIYWLFITSLKLPKDIATLDLQYWPKNPTLTNYAELWKSTQFPAYLRNSILVSVISGIIVVIVSIGGGYALARYRFRMKKVTLIGFLVSQMIPITLILVPVFLIFSKLGLNDTLTSLVVLYVILNTPFCVITMQGFFMNIPTSIEEAATIDGCGRMDALTKIVLPIMLPGIIAVFIFAFSGAWNDLLGGVMLINTEVKKTIPVGLSAYVGQFSINWGEMTAGGMLALIPSAILFAIAQKFIVEGLTAGAVKG